MTREKHLVQTLYRTIKSLEEYTELSKQSQDATCIPIEIIARKNENVRRAAYELANYLFRDARAPEIFRCLFLCE